MITACDAITVAAVARMTSGHCAQLGHEQEERAADVRRVVEDQRALAHVAEDAGGEHHDQPSARDRRAAEVPHVGVQRLRAGHRQHDGREGEERGPEVAEEEVERVGRGQRPEDAPGARRCPRRRTRR